MDDFDIKQPDESSFAPAGGYFGILKGLWLENIKSEFENEQQKQWKSLFVLYRYIVGYWTPEERTIIKQKFYAILSELHQLQNSIANNHDKKTQELYQKIQLELWDIAEELSLKQHAHNLYTPIREKGSALYG